MSLELSIGEAEAFAWKAARASGYSWGMAEEAAYAVGYLEMRGLPGLMSLVQLLDRTTESLLAARAAATGLKSGEKSCPITTRVHLADVCGTEAPVTRALPSLYAPWLLLPFIARIAGNAGTHVLVHLDNIAWHCTVTGEPDVASVHPIGYGHEVVIEQASNAEVAVTPTKQALDQHVQRARVSREQLEVLEGLAHQTYVPASEESRLRGAGAGLTDND